MRTYIKFSATAAMALAAPAFAQVPVIDGTADAVYGSAVAVQGIQTQFGNSNLGQPLFANGSELNGAFALVSNGILYLTFAGNLESNFNKLEIFFDTTAGGQNRLRGDNIDVDFNGLNRMGDDGAGNGLRFDAGFEADHFITVTGGDTGGGNFQLFSNYASLPTAGGGTGGFLGGSVAGTGFLAGNFGINIGLNNSNTAGVEGGTDAGSGEGVRTGVEIEIPLSLLSSPTGNFRISAFINGGGHDFLSNQVLGGAPAGTGNFGEPRNVDFSAVAGDQFFTVVQTPSLLKGDFNFDGEVLDSDISLFVSALTGDFASLLAQFPTRSEADFTFIGDFNSDGEVLDSDITGFVAALLGGGGRVTAIPEPAALGLLAPLGLLVSRRRR